MESVSGGALLANSTSGKVASADIHEEWGSDFACLQGQVTDLKSAYKQLPVHPSCRDCSVISVINPDTGNVNFFVARSLMFGQTAAVYAFLRISRALAAICTKLFCLTVV
eukprot:10887170-Karenia_brevis.AAC.1